MPRNEKDGVKNSMYGLWAQRYVEIVYATRKLDTQTATLAQKTLLYRIATDASHQSRRVGGCFLCLDHTAVPCVQKQTINAM